MIKQFNTRQLAMKVLLVLLGFVSCNLNNTENSVHQSKEITVDFQIDSAKINICNNFSILFEANGKTYPSHINGCSLSIPNIDKKNEKINVVFIYNDYKIKFNDVELKRLFESQKMNWTFIIKNPPFSNNDLNGLDETRVKFICYWQFNPQEYGEGIEIINPVMYH